jgi:hypothetical protein
MKTTEYTEHTEARSVGLLICQTWDVHQPPHNEFIFRVFRVVRGFPFSRLK